MRRFTLAMDLRGHRRIYGSQKSVVAYREFRDLAIEVLDQGLHRAHQHIDTDKCVVRIATNAAIATHAACLLRKTMTCEVGSDGRLNGSAFVSLARLLD